MPFLIVILSIFILYLFVEHTVFAVLLSLVIVIIVIMNAETTKKEMQKQAEEKARKVEEEKIAFEKLLKDNKVPTNYKVIKYKYGHPNIEKKNIQLIVWKDDNKIHFLDREINNNVGKIEISIGHIEYYEVRGEIHRETVISGGGTSGGGSSIGGAIAGGIIAGEVGAIIGSRKKVKSEPIKSKTVTHDERETFMNFYLGDKKHSMFFNFDGYNILLGLIPNKAYRNIYNNYMVGQINKSGENNIASMIKSLAKLKEEGIISEEEFQVKKEKLLAKI